MTPTPTLKDLAREAIALDAAMQLRQPFEYDEGEMLVLPSPSRMRNAPGGRAGWCGEAAANSCGRVFTHALNHYAALARGYLELAEEGDRLFAALDAYGRHTDGCMRERRKVDMSTGRMISCGLACSCGLDAALKESP